MKFHAASSVIYHEEHEGHEVNGILYETLRALRVLRGENKLLLAAEACSLFSALSPVTCCGHPRIDKPPWTSFKQELSKKCLGRQNSLNVRLIGAIESNVIFFFKSVAATVEWNDAEAKSRSELV
jgi:hypothetical protein